MMQHSTPHVPTAADMIEFSPGHPDPALLPVAGMGRAAMDTVQQAGPLALMYGAERGPAALLDQLRTHIGQQEGTMPPGDCIMITGGISQALDMLCARLTRRGDIVLVEAPTYHLALHIFRDYGLTLAPIPVDEQGLRVDMLENVYKTLQLQSQQVRFLYTIPTFNNPTGMNLAPERRSDLVALAQRTGLLIIEDDAYRELWYDAPPPPSLWQLAPVGPVIRLGSFTKVLAPGLRLGWMLATPTIVQRCMDSGLLNSGGGINHFTAQVVSTFLAQEGFDAHLTMLRDAYHRRRDILLAALARYLPNDCTWRTPMGGFFVWIRLPTHYDTTRLLPASHAAGVGFVPGHRFYSGSGGERYLRLSFSLLTPYVMEEGVRRLSNVLLR